MRWLSFPSPWLELLQVETLAIAAPGAREVLLRLVGLGLHALSFERGPQAVERPGIVRGLAQGGPEGSPGALGAALQEQGRAERLAHRVISVRRLVVGQRGLDLHRG